MLLCISHPLGCRYYIGDWDAKAEQFVPQKHGRMNWRRDEQSLFGTSSWRVDFFAPESLLTPDGRRVMWAWLATLGKTDGKMDARTIQSLPRELSLPADGILRIKPLRELETLRHDPVTLSDIKISELTEAVLPGSAPRGKKIATLGGDAVELRITIAASRPSGSSSASLFRRRQRRRPAHPVPPRNRHAARRHDRSAVRRRRPARGRGRGTAHLHRQIPRRSLRQRPPGHVASHADYRGKPDLDAFTVGAPTTIKKLEMWKLKPTNQGFLEAQKHRIWEPATR